MTNFQRRTPDFVNDGSSTRGYDTGSGRAVHTPDAVAETRHPGAGRPSDHLRIDSTAQSTVGFYEIFVRNLDQLPPRSPTSCAIRLLSSATLVPSMTDTSRVP